MKTPYKLAVLLLATSLILASCDKDEDEVVTPSPSQSDLLTANKWTMVDIKLDPILVSIWDSVPSCEKDDIIQFTESSLSYANFGEWDNGSDWCDNDSVQVFDFFWVAPFETFGWPLSKHRFLDSPGGPAPT